MPRVHSISHRNVRSFVSVKWKEIRPNSKFVPFSFARPGSSLRIIAIVTLISRKAQARTSQLLIWGFMWGSSVVLFIGFVEFEIKKSKFDYFYHISFNNVHPFRSDCTYYAVIFNTCDAIPTFDAVVIPQKFSISFFIGLSSHQQIYSREAIKT